MAECLRVGNRIVGALATPIVFWLLIGAGMGRSFQSPGGAGGANGAPSGYMAYFFPGTVVMILLYPPLKKNRPVSDGERSVEWSQFLVFTTVWGLLLVGLLSRLGRTGRGCGIPEMLRK